MKNFLFLMVVILCSALSLSADKIEAASVGVGQVAPAIELPTIDGKVVSLKQLRGKVVYLDFWASWCAPCRQSFPHFQTLRQELGNAGFEVVGVNIDENLEAPKRFLERIPVDFPIALDPQGNIPEKYGITGMPTSYIIDKNGVIRAIHVGFKESDVQKIKAQVTQLLDQ